MAGFLKNWVINNEFKKLNSASQSVNWADVKNICLVIPNDNASVSAAQVFKTESQKPVDVITYTNDKLTVNNQVHLSLNKKSLNWLDIPVQEVMTKLQQKNYDIVICGDLQGDSALRAITLLMKTKCRVGLEGLDYSKHFTISIAMSPSDGIGNFLKQVLKYLSLVKTN